jgi:hypothetical protein
MREAVIFRSAGTETCSVSERKATALERSVRIQEKKLRWRPELEETLVDGKQHSPSTTVGGGQATATSAASVDENQWPGD